MPRRIFKDRAGILTRILQYDQYFGDRDTFLQRGKGWLTAENLIQEAKIFRMRRTYRLWLIKILPARFNVSLLHKSGLRVHWEYAFLLIGPQLLLKEGVSKLMVDEEIVNLCFELGHIGPQNERALFHLVHDLRTSNNKVTDFKLNVSAQNMQLVRKKLNKQIQYSAVFWSLWRNNMRN